MKLTMSLRFVCIGVKKPHRYRPGTVALREIRYVPSRGVVASTMFGNPKNSVVIGDIDD